MHFLELKDHIVFPVQLHFILECLGFFNAVSSLQWK